MGFSRVVYLAGFSFIAAFAAAQNSVTMEVSQAGTRVGTARFSIQITSTGSCVQHQTMNVSIQGRSLVFDETGRDDRNGVPLTRLLHLSSGGQTAIVSVLFSNRVAKVVAKGPQGTRAKNVPAPKGGNLRNSSEFWFMRDHPRIGESVKYWQLDMEHSQWKEENDTYVGDETITIGGRKVRAHKVTTVDGPQWLDNKGMPLRLEFPKSQIVMVRR